jgi:hypothetical protein
MFDCFPFRSIPKDGGCKLLGNAGIFIPIYTVSNNIDNSKICVTVDYISVYASDPWYIQHG